MPSPPRQNSTREISINQRHPLLRTQAAEISSCNAQSYLPHSQPQRTAMRSTKDRALCVHLLLPDQVSTCPDGDNCQIITFRMASDNSDPHSIRPRPTHCK